MAAKRPQIAVPTTAPFSDAQLLPSTSPVVQSALSKLHKPALVAIALEWLKESNQKFCRPYIVRPGEEMEDESIYPAAHSLQELRGMYERMDPERRQKREVIDRIAEGDWRHGISLYQVAMLDMYYTIHRHKARRWKAYKLCRIVESGSGKQSNQNQLPRFHGPSFVQNIKRETASLLKAHFFLSRDDDLKLSVLRIQLVDSPYGSQAASNAASIQALAEDAFITLYAAFPDASPFVILSSAIGTRVSGLGGEASSLKRVVLEAIPKALSRPQERYTLEDTSLVTRSLTLLLSIRGGGRGNNAAGGWSIFADGTVDKSPLDPTIPRLKDLQNDLAHDDDKENIIRKRSADDRDQRLVKRRKAIAKGRFGNSGLEDDGKGFERFDVRMEEAFPRPSQRNVAFSDDEDGPFEETSRPTSRVPRKVGAQADSSGHSESFSIYDDKEARGWKPDIRLTFHGSHIFAGIRKLVESGAIDGKKIPGWMTGESGVSVAVVRHGRVRGIEGI